MSTDKLIQDLVSRHRAVKTIAAPETRWLVWALASMALVTAGVLLVHPRADWQEALTRPLFVTQIVFLPLLSAAAALCALRLGVPGRDTPFLRSLTWVVALAWPLSLLAASFLGEDLPTEIGWKCVRNIMLLSFLPAFLLAWMLKRAAPLRTGWASFFALLGSSALACAGTRFICPHDQSLHFLLWHCLPTLGMSFAGFFLGKYFAGAMAKA